MTKISARDSEEEPYLCDLIKWNRLLADWARSEDENNETIGIFDTEISHDWSSGISHFTFIQPRVSLFNRQ